MPGNHRKVSYKVDKIVAVVGCSVGLGKVVDHKEVHKMVAVHKGHSYKSFSQELISIIHYQVVPSKFVVHENILVTSHKLVSFVNKTFNY